MYSYFRVPIMYFNPPKIKGYKRGAYEHCIKIGRTIPAWDGKIGGADYGESEFSTNMNIAFVVYANGNADDVLVELYRKTKTDEGTRYVPIEADFIERMVRNTKHKRNYFIHENGRGYFKGGIKGLFGVSFIVPNELMCRFTNAHLFLDDGGNSDSFAASYRYRNNKGVDSLENGLEISNAISSIGRFIREMDPDISPSLRRKKNIEENIAKLNEDIKNLDGESNETHNRKDEIIRELKEMHKIRYVIGKRS